MGLASHKGIPTTGVKGDLNLGPLDDKTAP